MKFRVALVDSSSVWTFSAFLEFCRQFQFRFVVQFLVTSVDWTLAVTWPVDSSIALWERVPMAEWGS